MGSLISQSNIRITLGRPKACLCNCDFEYNAFKHLSTNTEPTKVPFRGRMAF